ncbi:uncharacterized protein [Nerophis lumbriciformis]|uniref:uncharacterized protein isoform X1 n=1 Tax=Nerophis lumbriciformis TaxID=546530 RepID=UPI002ADF4A8F|nr:uncharacterized protein LOC133575275 isoform X2 [Nerophis lumbriciformis]
MEEGRHRKVLTRVDPRHGERKGSPAWRKITTDLESLALDTVKWRSAASVQCWRNKFDEKTNELINDELGIAYPIIDGIPNMIPQEARLLEKTSPAQGHNLPS